MLILLRYWKPLALLLLIAGLIGGGYAWKAHNARQAAELAKAQAQLVEMAEQMAAAEAAMAEQEAANEAAQAARGRNDVEIPRVRRESAARVERAADPALPVADQLRDDEAATAGYSAAADRVRGKSAD